ncbi:MAG TPA: hypothetical protein VNU26_17725 [Mycobacteriales bacterium]|nr:hypothetical protein [Mycobacteriales bacterium]
MSAPPRWLGRAAGAALLVACLLLLAAFGALLVEDRSAVTTLLIVFAVVTVPALLSSLLALRPAVGLLRGTDAGRDERSAGGFALVLAIGHLGLVVLSLRAGLDRRFDGGDLAGAAAGATGMLAALLAAAVVLPGRTLGVRLVAGLGAGVLLLALVAVRALGQVD